MVKLSSLYDQYRDKIPGLYYIHDMAVYNPFWMNVPEPDPALLIRPLSRYGVYLGKTLYDRPYYWDPELVSNPMIALIGMPGAGKSHTLKTMIIRLKKEKGLEAPIIIVDPEDEYRTVVEQLGEGVVLEIGVKDYINILDRPAPNMNYMLWVRKAVIPSIMAALHVSENQAPRMIRILEDAIFKVYENKGFKPNDPRTWNRPDPTLKDVVDYLEGMLMNYEKGKEKSKSAAYMRTVEALYVRLKPWTSGEGSDFFAYPSTVPLRDLTKQSIVVFVIKKLPEEARDVFTMYIFNYFYALMEMLPPLPRFGIRIFLIFDEGWILLKKRRGQESPLSQLFRRARKYGFAAIIATQRYRDVSGDILPDVGTVFILRIRDAKAVKELKESLKLPDSIAEMIPLLPTGSVVVSPAWRRAENYANAGQPFIVRVEPAIELQVQVAFDKPAMTPEALLRGIRTAVAQTRAR